MKYMTCSYQNGSVNHNHGVACILAMSPKLADCESEAVGL